MARNKAFVSPGRAAPFASHENVHLQHETVRGPLPFFNPTQARFHLHDNQAAQKTGTQAETHPELIDDGKHPPTTTQAAVLPGAVITWRSRNNRKGWFNSTSTYLFLFAALVY